MKQFTKYSVRNSLRRILSYHGLLMRLKAMGVTRVYSYTLAGKAGVTPEQVRKDFSEYGIKGNRRGGYLTESLIRAIEVIFSRDRKSNVVVVGMGNLGQALSRYERFAGRGINIVATFDIDPYKHKSRSDIHVYPMERLEEITERFGVTVAILAVPEISAQEVCDELVNLGIRGIVNFSPVLLKVPQYVVVNNVNLSDEIESVILSVRRMKEEQTLFL
ncbi:MAG: redox-sensing transcriptional repressor Rex [Bacteroidales bacterium]|nr:redox-sensing transcriptional repressor Rex [Bacteroidales bacterium]MDT8374128.1 redox-sensing transcriptional repressor Rex [Bacteroidales bacterium]